MSISSLKKVVVHLRGADVGVGGFLPPDALGTDPVTLLTATGQTLSAPLNELVAIYFVSGFEAERAWPQLNGARSGPRLPGLWVRVRGAGQRWEGILASSLLSLDQGLWLTPLRAGSNCQRLYVPRHAIEHIEAVEVVRPARRRRSQPHPPAAQITLFDEVQPEGVPEVE